MKRTLLRLLAAHIVGSYATYLVEFVRQYFVYHTASIWPWVLGAPFFTPPVLAWFTFCGMDDWKMVIQLWVSYLVPAVIAYFFIRSLTLPPSAGLCINCGYDVRATPDRCPECGAVMKTPDLKSPA